MNVTKFFELDNADIFQSIVEDRSIIDAIRAELAAVKPVCDVDIYAAIYECDGVKYLRGTRVKKENAETERQKSWEIIRCRLVRADTTGGE